MSHHRLIPSDDNFLSLETTSVLFDTTTTFVVNIMSSYHACSPDSYYVYSLQFTCNDERVLWQPQPQNGKGVLTNASRAIVRH